MKRLLLAALLITTAPLPIAAKEGFVGTLKLWPAGCEAAGSCILEEDFGFIDSGGDGWQVRKGLKTDGASIPEILQLVAGKPFDTDLIRAAVIHDHYCQWKVRPWRDTHRVFRDALLASGVEPIRANIMYYAVLVGGPKWIKTITGSPCGTGNENCIMEVDLGRKAESSIAFSGSGIVFQSGARPLVIQRAARYKDAPIAADIAQAAEQIRANANLKAADIEQMARQRHPEDFYFRNGSAMRFQPMVDR
jgi:Protein of unknown function (DUF1353)